MTEPAKPRRELAFASLTCGVLTYVLFCAPLLPLLLGVLAIGFGVVALVLAQRGTGGGRRLAIAGIVIGFTGLFVSQILFVVVFGDQIAEIFRRARTRPAATRPPLPSSRANAAALEALLTRIRGTDAADRTQAIEALGTLDLDDGSAIRLIEEAARLAESAESDEARLVPIQLLRAAETPAGTGSLVAVARAVPRLEKIPGAVAAALAILTTLDAEAARTTFFDLLRRPAVRSVRLSAALQTLDQHPDHGAAWADGLLALLPEVTDRGSVFHALLRMCEAQALDFGTRPEAGAALVQIAGTLHEQHHAAWDEHCRVIDREIAAEEEGELPEEFHKAAWEYELLLDLLGFVPGPAASDLLRQGTQLRARLLAAFAVVSLLNRGEPVAPELIESLAGRPYPRGVLWAGLKRDEQRAMIPERWRTQEALAEANMVDWLTYPTEYGRVPEEILLLRKVAREEAGKPVEYYFYRFRAPGSQTWHVGIAGAFATQTGPTMDADATFSDFEEYDPAKVEEHLAAFLKRE